MDLIPDAYVDGVIKKLQEVGIKIPQLQDYSLGSLPNFYSLIPMAQQSHKAIFELNAQEALGDHYRRAQEARGDFMRLANAVLDRTDS